MLIFLPNETEPGFLTWWDKSSLHLRTGVNIIALLVFALLDLQYAFKIGDKISSSQIISPTRSLQGYCFAAFLLSSTLVQNFCPEFYFRNKRVFTFGFHALFAVVSADVSIAFSYDKSSLDSSCGNYQIGHMCFYGAGVSMVNVFYWIGWDNTILLMISRVALLFPASRFTVSCPSYHLYLLFVLELWAPLAFTYCIFQKSWAHYRRLPTSLSHQQESG